MKKKMLALLMITIMLVSLAPQAALAVATHSVADGQTLDLSTGELTWTTDGTLETTYTIADGDTISVAAGAAATITGSKNVMIDCGAGAALTLEDVTSNVSATYSECALAFTGSGNTLILSGTNTLRSSKNQPGVRVQGTAALEIAGDGSLDVTGGESAAGIGSGPESNSGTIRIGGNARVTATGGAGMMTATASLNGIPYFVINDAEMNSGAGIGGGAGGGNGGVITIEGSAHVTAMGSYESAGIGGGAGGSGGTINISGGVVYAVKGEDGETSGNDIGSGGFSSSGTVNISGGAAVFLGTNTISSSLSAPEHTHYEFTDDTEEVYGIAVPAEWEPTFGAYLKLCDLNYDKNGGDAPAVPAPVTGLAAGAPVTVADGSMILLDGRGSDCWNTAPDRSGKDYEPGDILILAGDTTLYAQWKPFYTLDYDKNEGEGTSPPTLTQKEGTKVTVIENPFTKDDHLFDGWNTAEDGSGEPYAPGDEFTFTGNTTLYARWAPAYTLDYDKNGGEGTPPSPLTQKEGTKATVIENPFTKDDHVFDGWNTVESGIGGEFYMPGDEFTFEENTTLYAQWTALYVLQYDKNDGDGTAPPTQTERIDSGVTATVVRNGKGMSRTGYTFSGWNTAKDGTGTPYDPGDDFTYEGVTTLYAQWKPDLTIDTPDLPAGTLGESYSCTMTAGGGEGGITWYASGLPEGMGIEKATGKISGKPNETGDFSVDITVCDGENRKSTKIYTLTVNAPGQTGKYEIVPDTDSAYTVGTTNGFTALTIKSGVTGFRYFKVSINPIIANEGGEACVFVQMRNGVQIGFHASVADFDHSVKATAGFNVKPGDIIKVYVVDELSNDVDTNPVLLQ